MVAATEVPNAADANKLTVDYRSGLEKKIVITGPLLSVNQEKVYTESELKEKFAQDKELGDIYNLSMRNSFPTRRLYTIRGVSLWDVFEDANIGENIYRNEDVVLQTVGLDGAVFSVGKGITVGGAYDLGNAPTGTLDLPRYTYDAQSVYLLEAGALQPEDVTGVEIPLHLAFAEDYVLPSPNANYLGDAKNTNQTLRPFFGQLDATHPNLPMSNNNTYRIVFSNTVLSSSDVARNASTRTFNLLGASYDRATILTGTKANGEKIRGYFEPETGEPVWIEGSGAAALLNAITLPMDTDYFAFLNAAGDEVVASFASIKAGNYTLVYATGTSAADLSAIERETGGNEYYFDLYRDGQPVIQNVNGIERANAPILDKSLLQMLVNKSLGVEDADYPETMWNTFKSALAWANTVLESGDVNQESVNSAQQTLEAALKALNGYIANQVMIDFNSGAERSFVLTGPLLSLESERVYTETELQEKFAEGLYHVSVLSADSGRNMYTIEGVSLWDVFDDAGISESIYRGKDYYLQVGGADGTGATVDNLDANRYQYPADSFLDGSEAGRETIPWYIATSESFSPVGYPANATDTTKALRTWFGQKNVNDANSDAAIEKTYRLVFTDSPFDPQGPDIHNNLSTVVFSLLGEGYDRANILIGPYGKGEKVAGRFKPDAAETVYFQGVGVASLLNAVNSDSVEDNDWFAFTNEEGVQETASFAEIAADKYTLVYATGKSANNLNPLKRTVGGVDYYFDLYSNGYPVLQNISGVIHAGAPIVDKTELQYMTGIAESLNENDYPANLWADLSNVLSEAWSLLNSEEARQRQIDAVLKELKRTLASMGAWEAATFEAETLNLIPGSTERSVNFNWYSNSIDSETSIVQIAPKSAMTGSGFPVASSITVVGTLGDASSGKSWHKAESGNLTPNTEYLYRISNDGISFSEAYGFTTGGAEDFSFIAVGDPQIDGGFQDVLSQWPIPQVTTAEGWADTIEKATNRFPGASFIVSVGDNIDSGGNESQWADFFAPEALRVLPLATVAGNHDTGPSFNWHFNNPNRETGSSSNYWYKYNNALFVALDTSGKPDADAAAQFTSALEKATEAHPDADWIFVIHHKSTTSPGAHRLNEQGMDEWADLLENLMDQFKVDFVLAGHDHLYSRSYHILNHEKNEDLDYSLNHADNPEGTLYFTLNTASGLKYSEIEDENVWYANISDQSFVPTYMTVNVDAQSASFTTFRTDNGEIVDQYTVQKEKNLGLGTETSPYKIDSAERLKWLADVVNNAAVNEEGLPYAKAWYVLTKDLEYDKSLYDEEGFDPIGRVERPENGAGNLIYPFAGHFDGQGHTINGLTINVGQIIDENDTYRGLFGYLDGAVVENLGLTGLNIKGHTNTGGITGYMGNGALIRNSYVKGSFAAALSGGNGGEGIPTRSIGGIVGEMLNSTIETSYFSGNIIGGGYMSGGVGGIAGWMNGDSVIRSCYSTGSILANGMYGNVGGIVGTMAYSSASNNADTVLIVDNCYSTAVVSNTVRGTKGTPGSVGGIAGNSAGSAIATGNLGLNCTTIISNCLALNPSLNANTGSDMPSVARGPILGGGNLDNVYITKSYAWEDMLILDNEQGNPASQATDLTNLMCWNNRMGINAGQINSSLPQSFQAQPWVYTTGQLPVLENLAGQSGVMPTYLAAPSSADKKELGELMWEAVELTLADYTEESMLPFRTALEKAKAVLRDKNALQNAVDSAAGALHTAMGALENEAWGAGTETEPYLINSMERLRWLAEMSEWRRVNEDGRPYVKAWYVLTKDIEYDGLGYKAIGRNVPDQEFAGNFDGQGHTINGLTAHREVIPYNTSSNGGGLFDYLRDATIKNLRLTGADFKVNGNAGGIAGFSLGSTVIENCFVEGSVVSIGGGDAGGIIGVGGGTSKVSNCGFTGSVASSYRGVSAGGIVGALLTGATAENCYSNGSVSSVADSTGHGAGGIAGAMSGNSVIRNCHSAGSVSNASFQALNNGSFAGGVVGTMINTGARVENSYSTATVSASGYEVKSGNYAGGIVGSMGNIYDGGIAGSGDVVNCVALNPYVNGSEANIGRIAGVHSGTSTIDHSYAWKGINLNGKLTEDNVKNGFGLRAGELQTADGWPQGFAAYPWDYQDGLLPLLISLDGQNGEMPAWLSVARGDVNGDGKINFNDYLDALNHYMGIPGAMLTGDKFLAADVNYDGRVNFDDALDILNHYMGIKRISD